MMVEAVQPQLIISAASSAQFPPERPDQDIEVAFLGRSNVGKSSLLNKLVRQPGLAFTSARPGCTQLINFFQIEEHLRFVDLPGYGYARVSLEERASWKKLIESYLYQRQSLRLSLLLIDARRGWMDMDLELKAWLEFHNRRFQVIATKVDKLKSTNQARAGLVQIQKQPLDQPPVPFSATDGRGVREIWQIISKIKNSQ
ncbi:MAG TPA: ribosome biogenesis GTP-binding protein YihA/YsxC [Bryobacteraceae bacterium]|jgi:GTP-binding protein|nr:ribosome biogenesis GTP-binding protein YihA/YsxC [Bryobacteraceae bacterium]